MQRGNGAVIGKQNTPTTSVATGVWALNEVQRAVLGGNWPASTIVDPYFDYTTLLLHGNGTNGAQNNTFLDSSTNNFTITRNGNTTQGTFTPYGSNWSNYFDGSGDYLSVADNAALDIPGDFTIEFWANVDSGNTDRAGIISHRDQSTFTNGTDWAIRVETSVGKIGFGYDSSGNYYDMGSYVVGEWAHYAITRSGTTIRTFKNGTQVATATSSSTWSSTAAFLIGRNVSGFDYKGFLSNVRLVKGTAVYTSNFTPSTAPLTAITNTSLLTCADNRFIDDSTNNFTITRNGDVSVQRFSPFNPTAAYSAATIGGSGYFDGSGDYLTFPNNASMPFGTGSFTIEFWINGPLNNDKFILGGRSAIGGSLHITTGGASSTAGALRYVGSSTITSGSVLITDSAWHHVAIVRNGSSNITLYIDGVSVGTGTDTTNYTGTGGTWVIGANDFNYPSSVGSNQLNAYLSDLRIVKSAVYTSAFTPPTAPLTAITNTSLLLNFTNGGIIDNAMMNDLETVGNAQISTSVSKFGGGSLAFDGNGDWLNLLTTPNITFGSGDFTFEGWLYLNSVTGTQIIFDQRPASTQGVYPVLYMNAAVMTWYINTTATITSSSLSTGVWYHFAVCRSSGSTRMFINGVQNGSTYADTNNYLASRSYIGISAFDQTGGLNGYIDDLRITKGYARYTANFTAPTLPFPDQ